MLLILRLIIINNYNISTHTYIYIFDKRVQLYLGHLMSSASCLPICVAEPYCICQFCTAVFPEYHRISHLGSVEKRGGSAAQEFRRHQNPAFL